jgi:hypothetical protein
MTTPTRSHPKSRCLRKGTLVLCSTYICTSVHFSWSYDLHKWPRPRVGDWNGTERLICGLEVLGRPPSGSTHPHEPAQTSGRGPEVAPISVPIISSDGTEYLDDTATVESIPVVRYHSEVCTIYFLLAVTLRWWSQRLQGHAIQSFLHQAAVLALR